MKPYTPRIFPAIPLYGAILALIISSPIAAQPPGGDRDAGGEPDPRRALIREQSIYIPYDKLRKVFEKQGRGVFLPYEKFQELWKAARDKTTPPVPQKAPVGALLTEVDSEATVAKDVVRVKALVKIEILAEGWNEIPLQLADVAITKATIGQEPARILSDANKGYKLLVEKKGKQPERIELALEYAKAITSTPGRNQVSFQAPRAPVSRWRVRIPEAGVKVNIHPLIAASEVPSGKADDPAAPGPNETVVLAFVGAAPTVRIDWTPKAEGATGLKALCSVQTEQQVTISEGVVRTRTNLQYKISRAELAGLAVDVPADHKVVNLFDANVRKWSVEKTDQRQRITVELFEPAKQSQQLTVELEKFTDDKDQTTVEVPAVRAMDVGRQQGVVVVQVAQGLRAEATRRTGLVQVDAAELPKSLAKGKWDFSYRYATVPFELALAIEKVESRILVDSLVRVELKPERIAQQVLAVYTIERAGVFKLELDLPEGYEVRRVEGRKIAGAAAAEVDTHHLTGEKKTRLVVNLARKAIGRVGLAVELQRELQEPDLLSPTGKAAKIRLSIPRVVPGTVQRDSGRLVIHAPESLRISTDKEGGLQSISFREAMQGMDLPGKRKTPDSTPALAFAYTKEPIELILSAQRRKPYVTVAQLLVARVEDDAVKYQATFFYDVRYSGVKSLRIDVPEAVAGQMRNKTSAVRDKPIDPQPDDVAKGYQAWSFTGETELLGRGKIELAWEETIQSLGIGKSIELEVPRLKPAGVDRAWGQIVLAKAETIDIHESEKADGLDPIDPQQDLMPGAVLKAAARAFEFHADWKLTVTATRYEMEEVKRTSIERAVVRMVVTRGDEVTVQALYRIKSARQRLEVKLPQGVQFDRDPLRINGRPVALERGEKGNRFVPLVDQKADKPFLVELRYSVPGDGSHLVAPEFPEQPAVLKVYLCVYLPEELALMGKSGAWTDEFHWQANHTLNWWRLHPSQTAAELVSWVCEGIEVTDDPANSFPTDGRLYIVSTLRPLTGDEGALRLTALSEKWLTAALLAVVILGGVLLLPAGAAGRAVGIGGLVTLLVVSGVFFPIFAMQIIDGYLVSAIFVVLILWAVQFFVWSLPRRQAARAVAKPAAEAPPPTTPATPEPSTPETSAEEPAEEEKKKHPKGDQSSPKEKPKPDTDEGGKTDA